MFSQKLSSFQQTNSVIWFIPCYMSMTMWLLSHFPGGELRGSKQLLHICGIVLKQSVHKEKNFFLSRDIMQAILIKRKKLPFLPFTTVWQQFFLTPVSWLWPLLQSLGVYISAFITFQEIPSLALLIVTRFQEHWLECSRDLVWSSIFLLPLFIGMQRGWLKWVMEAGISLTGFFLGHTSLHFYWKSLLSALSCPYALSSLLLVAMITYISLYQLI